MTEFVSLTWAVIFLLFYTPASIFIIHQLNRIRRQQEEKRDDGTVERRAPHFIKQSTHLFAARAGTSILWGFSLLGAITYLVTINLMDPLSGFTDRSVISLCTIQGINAFFNIGTGIIHVFRLVLLSGEKKARKVA